MSKPLRALIVEDSQDDAELVVRDLESRGYEVTHERVQAAAEMKSALERTEWDVVLSDYNMPTFSAMGALDVLNATGQDLPFIIVSGTIGEETAVTALKAGAHDFVVKGKLARLGPAIERELREVLERRARARTEEALCQSEARFRSLVDHAVFGIYQATLDGQFVTVNPALVSMLGYATSDELLSIGLPNLCVDATVRQDLLERVHALAQFTGEEMTWLQKSGEPVSVRLSGRRVETGAGLPIFEVIVEDYTERHRLESHLRQAQKMEAVGRLAGGIAHDFNNILSTIMGYTDMLVEQIGDDKPISGDLREIRNAGSRAAGLTRQLLAFSRQQVLHMGAVSVNDVVQDMRAMLQRLIGEDITIELTLADGLPQLFADRVQLEQVLMNIAANARDAMPRGGRLMIRTYVSQAQDIATLTGLSAPAGRYVTLALGDDGEGMDARTRERIFDPFFTTKDLGKGTGLGLATVYGIVKQLGGYIWVSSTVPGGTTFTLFFPESTVSQRPLDTSPPAAANCMVATAREVVLVAEDEAALRTLVARTLTRHGYRVLEADSGRKALEVAAEAGDALRLVIADVVMPMMGGPELVSELRKTRPDVKVLYMSGYAGDMISRGSAFEADTPILEKPFNAQDLLQAVRTLLNAQ
jgi:PAS domain S-box-containing protein